MEVTVKASKRTSSTLDRTDRKAACGPKQLGRLFAGADLRNHSERQYCPLDVHGTRLSELLSHLWSVEGAHNQK